MLLRHLLSRSYFSTTAAINSGALLRQLREESGSPVQQCKAALEASGGNLQHAKQWLKEKGLAQAEKKLQKETREGIIGVQLLPDRRSALLLEVKIKIFATLSENKPINNNSKKKVNCETDFVARNTLFQSFVKGLLASAAQNTVIKNSGDVQEGAAVDSILQTQQFGSTILDGQLSSTPIDEVRRLVISKLQENINVRRLQHIATQSEREVLGIYVHNEIEQGIGSSACVAVVESPKVNITQLSQQQQKNANAVAMQILGHKPLYYTRSDIPKDVMDAEVDKVKKELGKAYDGKTADIQVRMLEGKLHRFLDDTVLMEMEFILQEGQLVKEFFQNEFGEGSRVLRHVLWGLKQ